MGYTRPFLSIPHGRPHDLSRVCPPHPGDGAGLSGLRRGKEPACPARVSVRAPAPGDRRPRAAHHALRRQPAAPADVRRHADVLRDRRFAAASPGPGGLGSGAVARYLQRLPRAGARDRRGSEAHRMIGALSVQPGSSVCTCAWPGFCDGTGWLVCRGCGGDACGCRCGGCQECPGCKSCQLPKPYYEESGITIYHADCRNILPHLPRQCAIVSDPPYGMDWDGKVNRGPNGTGSVGPTRNYGVRIVGDDRPFDPSDLISFPEVLLWGFNHFPEKLKKGTALVWLKRYDDGFGSFLSDAEIAWLNSGCGVYCRRDVSMQAESAIRIHPTQKPASLMRWCIGFIKSNLILDPFMGS